MNTTECGFEVVEIEAPGDKAYRYYVVEGATLRIHTGDPYSASDDPNSPLARVSSVDKIGEQGWFDVVTIHHGENEPPTVALRLAIAILFGVTDVEQTEA